MSGIEEKKIDWHPKTLKISQIPKKGLEYAFLTENYKQIHQLVWCKDFMQDVIYGHLNQKTVAVFGFEYNPKRDPPLYMAQTRIMLSNWRDKDFRANILSKLKPFLHALEEQLKMSPTVFEKCIAPPPIYKKSGVYIVNGDKRWMCSPPMISLYTLLLRVGLVHNPEDTPWETICKIADGHRSPYYNPADKNIVQSSQPGILKILRHGDKKIFYQSIRRNYPKRHRSGLGVSVFTIHDSWGLAAFSCDYTKSDFPHWHRKEVA